MAGRSALLSTSGTQNLISWISRSDTPERFEMASQPGYADASTPDSLQRQGVPLHWIGSAGEGLGLQGTASPQAAARVLTHGRGPQGEILRTKIRPQGAEQERKDTIGWVLAAPKSVSLLMIHPDETVRQHVQEALDVASQAAIQDLESSLTIRRGRGGYRSEKITGLIGVKTDHFTSSAGDPHLHTHFILNASAPSQRDGKWRALDSKVFFAAQRVAEAAFQSTLRIEITTRLSIDPTDWIQHQVGSVPTWEIKSLSEAADRYSRATAHMQEAAQKLGTRLGTETYREHGIIWARHRRDKAAAAEPLEHVLDAALAAGTSDAQAIRHEWTHRLGPQRAALAAIHPRDRRTTIQWTQALKDPRWCDVKKTQQLRDHIQQLSAIATPQAVARAEEIKKTHTDHYLQTLTNRVDQAKPQGIAKFTGWILPGIKRQQKARVDLRQQEFTEAIKHRDWAQKILHTRDQLQEKTQQLQTLVAHQDRSKKVLDHLTQTLGVLSPTDVIAWVRGQGYTLADSRTIAANLLTHWHQESLILSPPGSDPQAIITTVQRGSSAETRLQQRALSHAGKLVPTALWEAEQTIRHTTQILTQTHRRSLLVNVSGLTPDQARAASTIAAGRALTAVQGVAGAGKTHMMQAVVRAAQKDGLDILVLGRNAKLAHELGSELGVTASTLAKFRKTRWQARKPTLLIVDEAGLVDQVDWQAILDASKKSTVQVVALGDRYQAQPIDKRGTWAVITQAAQTEGGYAELTQTFRNKAWAEEAQALRNGERDALQRAEHDHRILGSQRWHLTPAEVVAREVLARQQHGEDALGIAATNEEASEIARAIQTKKEIPLDSRTHLRWGQQTGRGDLVRTRKNEAKARIRNGDTWIVHQIDDQSITLHSQVDPRHGVKIPHQWAEQNLELAYAATVDSAQGVTVDRTIVSVAGMGRTRLYSAATRGRQAPVYVTEASEPTSAKIILSNVLNHDDLAPTMQEILSRHHQEEQQQNRLAQRAQDWDLER